jgi:ADP-heptose:LPS heptosyltransferase
VNRALKRLYRILDSGRNFKRYAPQASPASSSTYPRKLAICDLIPNLGDKVMLFPLLDAIRKQNPELEISFFTQGAGRLIEVHPAIDHLYLFEKPGKGRLRALLPNLVHLVAYWWQNWRSLHFHTVVVLRGGADPFRSHHLAWLIGGSSRYAYSPALEPERPEYQYDVAPLFTELVTEMRGVHEVTRGCEVLQLAGLLTETVAIKEPVKSLIKIAHSPSGRTFLQHQGLDQRPYGVIALGASVPRREWSIEGFAEVSKREITTRGWRTVLVGGPDTKTLAQQFRNLTSDDTLDLTGMTDFLQLVAVCGGAQCFLGNDSGPAHIAGACGVPALIVTAFAQSGRKTHHASPDRSHPVGPLVSVVQPANQLLPCTTECVATEVHCIAQVTAEDVQVALRNLLHESVSNKSLVTDAAFEQSGNLQDISGQTTSP